MRIRLAFVLGPNLGCGFDAYVTIIMCVTMSFAEVPLSLLLQETSEGHGTKENEENNDGVTLCPGVCSAESCDEQCIDIVNAEIVSDKPTNVICARMATTRCKSFRNPMRYHTNGMIGLDDSLKT
jgi:hypothetical protein